MLVLHGIRMVLASTLYPMFFDWRNMAYKPTKAASTLPENVPLMLKTEQAASILNVSRKHLNDLLREGSLRGVKVGTTWRIPRAAILEMVGE